jgi:hypothetical protein
MTHIRKISAIGEAARLSHDVLRVGCTLVCIDRRPIDRDIYYDAQALARACAPRPCTLTFSYEPSSNIEWVIKSDEEEAATL